MSDTKSPPAGSELALPPALDAEITGLAKYFTSIEPDKYPVEPMLRGLVRVALRHGELNNGPENGAPPFAPDEAHKPRAGSTHSAGREARYSDILRALDNADDCVSRNCYGRGEPVGMDSRDALFWIIEAKAAFKALSVAVSETAPSVGALDLADAVLAYDAAIYSCANDPDKMASFCTAQGDDLDALYLSMVNKARGTR